ncbi:pre-mRNA splicing factor 18, putative [Eimeria tenella]|uniref:Pre-mRNA-splicing factor 18 n=1 Tax=Eimeria tenella TaxID=5802 RepID=U6KQN0_EIMTE|nr:pre-mRNA splicing factor 18, putative [Eimeria tenella]CDJ38587.1 pre-mRNA splicing factor 18, putative [Eimeria tenella]|eukprot:XP_013229425.1 pre-mRNA splicing factor 18, putative [Eimeria tenella]
MEALRAIIAKQKEKAKTLPRAAGRYISQKELQQQQREEKQKEEELFKRRQKQKELDCLLELQERLAAKRFRLAPNKAQEENAEAHAAPEEATPPVETPEVFRRLRAIKQPVTLFGETPWERYQRLCRLEVQLMDDEMPEGQKNVFLSLQKEAEEEEEIYKGGQQTEAASKETEKPEGQIPKEETKEDVVINWIREMLSLWEQELREKSEEEKATPEGRQQASIHRQTKKDLRPLIKRLRQRDLELDILEKLFVIVNLAKERKYREAHGAFVLLAVGNAPWPMGVTMVGIHERAGRSKLNVSQVAHILNDETTRKFIQMLKRLLSFAQRKFPTDPSQTVLLSVHHV